MAGEKKRSWLNCDAETARLLLLLLLAVVVVLLRSTTLSTMISLLLTTAAVAWGPAGGWPGTMDAAHNVALPPSMRSYLTNRSVVAYFIGNDSAANSPAENAAEERFGILGVGWQLSAIASNFTGLETHELAAARQLKAARPGIKVMVARNTDCGALNQNAVAAALKAHPEWFLRDARGVVFEVPWVANDPKFFGHQNFWMPSPYFNYSVPAASKWWVQEYVGAAVKEVAIDGVYWDACGPQAPPTKMRSFPCPGRKQPPVEPDCHYPKSGLIMSGAAVAQYYADAHSAFAKAQALIASAGKWSSTWAAASWGNETCCRGCKPECRAATIPECVASVVKLVEAANMTNHTLQLRVPLPAWTATSGPPSRSNGDYLDFWVKLFLLVRGEQSLLYFPGQGGAFSYAKDYPRFPASMDDDYGTPLLGAPTLGAGPGGPLSLFTREWQHATVTLDCSSFEATVTPRLKSDDNSARAPPAVTLGPVEVVRDSAAVDCGPAFPAPPYPPTAGGGDLDIPDEPCRAWKRPGGDFIMLATHTAARYDRGNTLSKLKHDCHIVFNSTWDPDPSRYDDRTWLMSPWVSKPGAQTIYALAHMEFHGWTDVMNHARCLNASTGKPPVAPRGGEPHFCWYNAVVLLKSTDSGETFGHARPPPHHLVATAPYRYPKHASVGMGLGDMSNVYLSPKDGFLYMFANSRGNYKAMKAGRCLMRTRPENLPGPTSWRGWNGTGFSVTFVNPYTAEASMQPAEHVCEPLNISFSPHYLGWSAYYRQFIVVGSMNMGPPSHRLGMVFSLSDDILAWGAPQLLRPDSGGDAVKEAYPTLLDEVASAGFPNVDRVGKNTSYLYYMRSVQCNTTGFGCRNVLRQRVSFKADDGAFYSMTTACTAVPGHPTDPMVSRPHERGVQVGTGSYNITVCNNTAWTFRSLWHSEHAVLTATGFAQTVSNVVLPDPQNSSHFKIWPPLQTIAPSCPVITRAACPPPKPGSPKGSCSGFLGTGHGGEYVFSVTLHGPDGSTVDLLQAALGQKKRWPTAGRMSVIKQSQIGAYLATQNVTLDPADGMIVTANYTLGFDHVNSDGHSINWFYPTMSMFALPFKQWAAQLSNGTMQSGVFTFDSSFTLQQDIHWVAVFDDDTRRGAVYQYPVDHAPKGRAPFENSFWNRKYDHKLYLQLDVPIVKGSKFGLQHTVTAFTASSTEPWLEAAKKVVKWPLPKAVLKSDDSSAPPSNSTCGKRCKRFVFPDATQTHGARCLDGSPPGFYVRPGLGADAAKFLVYSHGGSWCYDNDESDTSSTWNCAVRASTYEGSSLHNPPSGPPRKNMKKGIMSTDCTKNPRFCKWSVVYFMYCDGSSWASDRDEPQAVDPAKFKGISQVWSRGHRNMNALWDRLLQPQKFNATATGIDLSKAAQIIVTGASAGGFMTFYHCDELRRLVPSSVPLRCVADCAFWPGDTLAASGKPTWATAMRKMVTLHNASGGLDASCIAAHSDDPSFCAHPPNVLPYITTPIFISTSHQDTDATSVSVLADGRGDGYTHATVPPPGFDGLTACFTTSHAKCVGKTGALFRKWTATITALLAPAMAPSSPHGCFVNRCYRHHNIDGDYTFDTMIGGTSLIQSIGDWVYASDAKNTTKLIDLRPALGGSACLKLDDSEVARSTPLGWRSWNAVHLQVTASYMMRAMDALLEKDTASYMMRAMDALLEKDWTAARCVTPDTEAWASTTVGKLVAKATRVVSTPRLVCP